LVHREVGAPEQGVRLLAVARVKAQTHAHRDPQSVAVQIVVAAAFRQKLAGHFPREVRVQDPVENDGELIRAHARDGVGLAKTRAQARRDLPQQLVARVAPQRVVHQREPIDVGREHGEPVSRAARARQREREPVVEQVSVRQAGELVVERQVLQGLGDLQQAQVLQNVGEMRHASFRVAQGKGRFEHVEQVAGSGAELRFFLPGLARQQPEPHVIVLQGAGGPEAGEIGARKPLEMDPKHPAQTGVGVFDRARRRSDRHADGHLLDDSRKILWLPCHGSAPATVITIGYHKT